MPLQILVSQQNYTVGAIENNAQQMLEVIKHNQSEVDIIIFSELSITGYPPEDWLLRSEFQQRVDNALQKIQEAVDNAYVIVGHPILKNKQRFNAASVLHQKKIMAQCYKQLLPNYGIFDEKRYFVSGSTPCVFDVKHHKIGLLICEDSWGEGPWKKVVDMGAELIISPNASPFERNKQDAREAVIRQRQKTEGSVPIIYVNAIGGQDELIFDGRSFAMDAQGNVCWRAKAFEVDQGILLYSSPKMEQILRRGDWQSPFSLIGKDPCKNHQGRLPVAPTQDRGLSQSTEEALIYQALVLGTRDYLRKNGFQGALVGLSGGIDSALTLAIATDALGPENVEAVMMPSRYTAAMSLEDAESEIKALGVASREISIEPTFNAFLLSLPNNLNGVTEQNLQARCRGMLLMALSNETGKLLLTTSNKSEVAVGYCTLYGDMAGALAVLKDVLKTSVYRLAHYRNSLASLPVIPERVLTRAPSAELASNQTDQDSLPPYDILDNIIEQYVEKNKNPEEIIASGIDPATVTRIIRLIHQNEYKRRQSAPGIKITSRAFGRDWRYPILLIDN